jgi:drug/metabolite transporter (DMT)-like permease
LIYLIASIVLTSYLTLSFKVVERLRINNLQAIVFNYFTCVVTGSVVNGSFPVTGYNLQQAWFKWALLMGLSFIVLFNIIAFSAQKIGVAITSVANKLSLVIPFLFSLYLYKEPYTWLKITGVLVAVAAVLFTCWPQHALQKRATTNYRLLLGIPAILFIGSGLLDTMVKYVEQHFLNDTNYDDYLVTAFATAGAIGMFSLLFLVATGRQQFSYKAVLAGIAIGVPNYFSIWCLMKVLKQYSGNSSAVFPIVNMGIVLFSAVMALVLFKEHLSKINWLGIILSLAAIALIAFG